MAQLILIIDRKLPDFRTRHRHTIDVFAWVSTVLYRIRRLTTVPSKCLSMANMALCGNLVIGMGRAATPLANRVAVVNAADAARSECRLGLLLQGRGMDGGEAMISFTWFATLAFNTTCRKHADFKYYWNRNSPCHIHHCSTMTTWHWSRRIRKRMRGMRRLFGITMVELPCYRTSSVFPSFWCEVRAREEKRRERKRGSRVDRLPWTKHFFDRLWKLFLYGLLLLLSTRLLEV